MSRLLCAGMTVALVAIATACSPDSNVEEGPGSAAPDMTSETTPPAIPATPDDSVPSTP